MAEQRSPKPQVGGSSPSWPAIPSLNGITKQAIVSNPEALIVNAKVNSEGSKFDALKWVIVAAIVTAGVVGNSVYADQSLFYRVVALLVLAGVAGFVALQTAKGKAFFTVV